MLQLNLKASALHAQGLHGLGNGTGKAWRGQRTLLRNLASLGLKVLVCSLLCSAQAIHIHSSIQLTQLLLPALQQGGQFLWGALVAACQLHP